MDLPAHNLATVYVQDKKKMSLAEPGNHVTSQHQTSYDGFWCMT